MIPLLRRAPWEGLCFVLVAACLALGDNKPPRTGPATEKRFPSLKVPPGFHANLFACDPLVEYPSAIALGPRPGSLFVAIDYMTGLGTGLERRDEIRLIEDTDGDGYADKSTVFATGLNSVQGLLYHDGTLFVMHAPYLTALRDTKGTGNADQRRDLLIGLGLPPEQDQIRLHNANGVVVGYDGWLYLALGDRGCDVKRPEGDRLVLEGGGILRCRPDGRDLHVFSTGLRNIYDIALDEDLNVFVRDNENDGGDYKIRVCHSFHGADHGYPYLYYEHPDEALAPLADLGLGSSAGAVCYLEKQFPPEYRGSLLFCEWGRAVVRYPLKRAGASFASTKEIDFAAGAPADPYGFKPTDLVVDRAGDLFIADWADGQRPRRGRGRIYRVRHAGKKEEKPAPVRKLPLSVNERITWLDSESSSERCLAQQAIERLGKDGATAVAAALKKGSLGVRGRLHAVRILANMEGPAAVANLFALAKADPEPRVQAQAVRAVADLTDPILVRHRLDAPPGDVKLAERLATLAEGKDVRVQLEVVVALGRLRWTGAPAWVAKTIPKPDVALAHAAQGALRRSGNWPAVLKLLDEPASDPIRGIARRAIACQYHPQLANGLIDRLKKTTDATRRREYADLLTRVCRKPPPWKPWMYWGFRPPPRPAHTVAWERTAAIEEALDSALAKSDGAGRMHLLRRMLREKVRVRGKTLGKWLAEERDPAAVATLLAGLGGTSGSEVRPSLEALIRDRKQTAANRLAATALFLEGLTGGEARLAVVAAAVEDGPILAALLRGVAARKDCASAKLVLEKTASANAEVRAATVEALAVLKVPEARDVIGKMLTDAAARVRAAAARAVGQLALRPSAAQLLKLARDPDASVRRSSLEALRRLREPRALAVAVAALNDDPIAVTALECVGDLGGPAQAVAVAQFARRRPSTEVLAAAGKVLSGWAAREELGALKRQQIESALAEIHGGSGVLLGWHIRGPLPDGGLVARLIAGRDLPTGATPAPGWRIALASGIDARVRLRSAAVGNTWLAYTEAALSGPEKVEFFITRSAPATVWLNGKVVYENDRPGVPGPYPERFEAELTKGVHRLLVRLSGVKGEGEFSLRFRRKSATAGQERLARAALSRAGNPENGRKVFLAVEKSLCLKCHRVSGQGEQVGPDLTGLGSRFSKAYIIESILEPSRTVSPSFESTLVELKSGKVLAGIKVAETETAITLVDNEAKKHVLARSAIEAMRKQPGSAMPDGLEKRLTEDEFVDLVSFLVNLKERRAR
jgi:putative membrane-bound dehydrogenase-like protein